VRFKVEGSGVRWKGLGMMVEGERVSHTSSSFSTTRFQNSFTVTFFFVCFVRLRI